VFSGVAGVGAEFGHMTMDPNGELCSCGNYGCWETQVSQRALFHHIRKSFEQGERGTLYEMTNNGQPLTVPVIVDAARTGDAVAQAAFERIGRDLGIGIASLVNALNPELVVFGGVLSLGGEFLMPAVVEEIERRALRWNREATDVVLAQHGFDAAVMGGVAAVYETILAQPNLTGSLEL
jgi:predicted NBD/HSP70 family sugar kinase